MRPGIRWPQNFVCNVNVSDKGFAGKRLTYNVEGGCSETSASRPLVSIGCSDVGFDDSSSRGTWSVCSFKERCFNSEPESVKDSRLEDDWLPGSP